MDHSEAYFLPVPAKAPHLDDWAEILPPCAQIIRFSLFADVFVLAPDGTVHMLEPAAGKCSQIAASQTEFWDRVQADEHGWQLRTLADRCWRAGKILGPQQCYAFTQLPYLGGEYVPENVWVCSLTEWISLTADIYQQTKDLPDGASVRLQIID